MEREIMEFDVIIVGSGPAGLSSACRLMQLARENNQELSVCVVEKGAEVGAHILSGAVLDPRALDELFPTWKEMGAPINTPVITDEIYLLRDADKAFRVPNSLVPRTMHNDGNYIISLGSLCRWLAQQAESLGVDIFPGFPAADIVYDENGAVKGIVTGDMGVDVNGVEKDSYMPGMELRAHYTIFAEGCRGHLGKQLLDKYNLQKEADSQHYALGIKELWEIEPGKHKPGLVIHSGGWPLEAGANGGGFLYHTDNNQVSLGLIVDLNYSNPHLSPFEELQRMKHHPVFKRYLEGGKRISYGARAITKGGFNSIPKMNFPGGVLVGCDAGTLNFAKIKGTHTAMKGGMIAAETIYQALQSEGETRTDLKAYSEAFKASWVYIELYQSRNFGPAMHKFGTMLGGAFNYIDQNWFKGNLPFTLRDNVLDHTQLETAKEYPPIDYPKPDGVISFDRLSSVFQSNTNHEEDQPCHLHIQDTRSEPESNLMSYNELAKRYCPAGVYEVIQSEEGKRLQINGQNCLHCKTCDIKDPAQKITWTTPEGSGGPNYPNM